MTNSGLLDIMPIRATGFPTLQLVPSVVQMTQYPKLTEISHILTSFTGFRTVSLIRSPDVFLDSFGHYCRLLTLLPLLTLLTAGRRKVLHRTRILARSFTEFSHISCFSLIFQDPVFGRQ